MKKLMLLVLPIVLLTGCWDSRDIEELSIVMGAGLDKSEDGSKIRVTNQIIVPPVSAQMGDKYTNIVTTGNSVQEALRDVALIKSPLMSEHERVIILNKELLEEYSINAIINQYIRDDHTRRSCYVFVSRVPAKNILDLPNDPNEQQVPANTLYELSKNYKDTNKIFMPLSLGRVSEFVHSQTSFAIPNVSILNNHLTLDGAGVIKNDKWVDYFDTQDIQALTFLNGDFKGGVIQLKNHNQPLSVEILKKVSQDIKVSVEHDQLVFNIKIATTGRLSEDWYSREDSFNQKYINNIGKKVEKQVKSQVMSFVEKSQEKEYFDVTLFGRVLRAQQPTYWDKHRNDWQNKLNQATVHYEFTMDILDFGTKGAYK